MHQRQTLLASNILHSVYAAEALWGANLLGRYLGPVISSGSSSPRFMPRRVRETRSYSGFAHLPLRRLWLAEIVAKGGRLTPLDSERQALLGRRALDASIARKLGGEAIVHVNSAGLVSTAERAKRLGAFLVCDAREPHPATISYRNPLGEFLEQEFALADLIIVNSELSRTSFVEAGIEPGRLGVVPLGVDPRNFSPLAPPSGATGLRRVLFVGALSHRKGPDVLVSALSQLPADLVVRLAGPLVDERITELVHKSSQCSLLGPITRSQVRDEYRLADLLVLPSRSDSYPLVTLEAIACGTPVVVTDRCGTSDLVREHDVGLVVRADDAADLASAMAFLSSNPERLHQLSENCRSAAKHLTWQSYGDVLVDIYHRRVLPQIDQM